MESSVKSKVLKLLFTYAVWQTAKISYAKPNDQPDILRKVWHWKTIMFGCLWEFLFTSFHSEVFLMQTDFESLSPLKLNLNVESSFWQIIKLNKICDIMFYNSGDLKWDIVEFWVDTQTMCSSVFDHIYPKFLLCNDKGWQNTFLYVFSHDTLRHWKIRIRMSKILKYYLDSRTKGWTWRNTPHYWLCVILRTELVGALFMIWCQHWTSSTEKSACRFP